MKKEAVMELIQDQISRLNQIESVLNGLELKKIYNLDLMIRTSWDIKVPRSPATLIAQVKTFNKESVRLRVFAARGLEGIDMKISSYLTDRWYSKAADDLREEANAKGVKTGFRQLPQEYKDSLVELLKIDHIEVTMDYDTFHKWSEFDPSQAPLVMGSEYLSPKFKKQYFKS
jgi:hypothetical protein